MVYLSPLVAAVFIGKRAGHARTSFVPVGYTAITRAETRDIKVRRFGEFR